jgi:hypothetical protein
MGPYTAFVAEEAKKPFCAGGEERRSGSGNKN